MTSHHQDSVVLNSPSSSPALPPRGAPVGGKTCPAGHIHKPNLPHHALPPITPPHTMDRPRPKSPVDRSKQEHEHDPVAELLQNQSAEEENYIPEAVEETTVHNLLGQAAKRQYI